MNFVEEYSVDLLKTADYNPRVISTDSFNLLKKSLLEFGVCKPVIINKDRSCTCNGSIF
jgi:ParB-like chromosome segregation protein Spo0J